MRLGQGIPFEERWRGWSEAARLFAGPRLLESAGLDDLLARLLRRLVLVAIGFWVAWRLAAIWELPRLADGVVAAWIVALSLPLAAFTGDALRLFEERLAPRTETRLDDTALPLVNTIARFVVVAAGCSRRLAAWRA